MTNLTRWEPIKRHEIESGHSSRSAWCQANQHFMCDVGEICTCPCHDKYGKHGEGEEEYPSAAFENGDDVEGMP